jgi:amino acid transporter
MKTLWFKRKRYGWGWTPATWQGWLIVLIFIIALVWNFHRLDSVSHSASDTLRPFIIQTFAMSLVLIGLCYVTGEKPRWQWGEKK